MKARENHNIFKAMRNLVCRVGPKTPHFKLPYSGLVPSILLALLNYIVIENDIQSLYQNLVYYFNLLSFRLAYIGAPEAPQLLI